MLGFVNEPDDTWDDHQGREHWVSSTSSVIPETITGAVNIRFRKWYRWSLVRSLGPQRFGSINGPVILGTITGPSKLGSVNEPVIHGKNIRWKKESGCNRNECSRFWNTYYKFWSVIGMTVSRREYLVGVRQKDWELIVIFGWIQYLSF